MPRAENPPLRAEHSSATRSAIVESARRLFAERGFAAVSIEDIVRQARVTRGALYHHFRDKRDLFAVVTEEVERDVTQKVLDQAELENDALAEMLRGTGKFLDLCTEQEVRQITIVDGLAVLGYETHHEIHSRYGLALVRGALTLLAEQKRLKPELVEPLSHLVFGAVLEAAMAVGKSEDPAAEQERYRLALEEMLRGVTDRAG